MNLDVRRGRSRPTTSAKSRPGTAKVTPLDDDTEAIVKEHEEGAKERKEQEDEKKKNCTGWDREDIKYSLCSHQESYSGDCDYCKTIKNLAEGSTPQDASLDTQIAEKPSHGFIHFGPSTKKESNKKPYIRFNPDYNVKYLLKMMKDEKVWGLSMPQVLITVAGGAQGYKLDAEVARQFKKGLVNVANNNDIWITTGGTDYGVMSFVGKVIEEHSQNLKEKNKKEKEPNPNKRANPDPVLIGFVPWSIVRYRVNLDIKNGKKEGDKHSNQTTTPEDEKNTQTLEDWQIRLNTNHTHFVFVDDGKVGNLGGELDLRARFETSIYAKGRESKRKDETQNDKNDKNGNTNTRLSGLVVGVLLEGGLYSLQTVTALIVEGIPVVVAAGSGRMADVLAFAIQNTGKPDSEKPNTSEKSEDQEFNPELQKKLEDTLGDIKMVEEAKQKWQEVCKGGYNKELKLYDIRNPYRLNLSEVLLDTALKTVIGDDERTEQYRMDILRLTVGWNCYAIAKTIIFNKKRDWEESWRKEIIEELFWQCVKKNQHEFICLLLDNECITSKELNNVFFKECFENFSDEDGCMLKPAINLIGRMIDLEIDVKKLMKLKSLYKRSTNEQNGAHDQVDESCSSCCNCVNRYKKWKMEKEKEKEKANEKAKYELGEFEENQLVFTCFFLLSTYLRHHETAKVFWERGTNFLANLLLGMRLYKSMADDEPDREKEFLEKARDFEQIVMDLLEISNERDVVKLRELLIAGNTLSQTHSVLGLAELAGHEQFIAHSSCQRILDEVWFGAIRKERALFIFPKIWAGIFFPLPTLWLMKYNGLGNILDSGKKKKDEAARQKTFGDQNQHRIKIVESKHGESTPETEYEHPNWFAMFMALHRAPITKFFTTLFFYILFLGLFMWVVIGELPADIQWKEYCLAACIFSFTTEEIVQVIAQPGLKKLHRYTSDLWNLMDVCGILLFWLAFGLRFGLRRNSKNTARVFYLFDLFFWFMRSTHFFNLSKELGPILTMILNMIPKLLRFCGIWFLFIYSFGIIMKSITKPKHADDVVFYDLVNIINFSYWQVYGELFLDDFDESIHQKPNEDCTNGYKDGSGLPPCPYWPRLSIYFLAVYMLIGHLLLMNLLIAMFSSVYEDVNRRSVAHWKSKRLALVVEYHTRSMLPPPFTVLYHLFFAFRRKKYREQIKRALGLRIKHGEHLLTRLKTFEREVKEEYLLLNEKREALDVNSKVRSLEEEVEEMATNVREMKQGQDHIKQELRKLGARFDQSTLAKELKRTTDNLCREVTENLREQVTRLKSSLEEEAALRKSAEKTLEDVKNMLRSSKTT